MISCDPSSLANAARCFDSCARGPIGQSIKSYLLCQYANGGTPVVAPAAPSNPDFDDASNFDAAVKFTWTNNAVPEASSIEVWRSVNGGAYALRATVVGAASNYTDPGTMAIGDLWCYKVRACNGATCSPFTAERCVGRELYVLGQGAFNYPTLILHFGSFDSAANGDVTDVSWPLCRKVTGAFAIPNSTINTFNLSALISTASSFILSGGVFNPNALNMPSMTSCGTDFDVSSLLGLTSANLPALTTVGGVLSFVGDNILASIAANALVSVGGDFSMAAIGAAALSFPALATVGGNLSFNGDTALASISLPALVSVGSTLGLDGIGAAVINFPVLATVGVSLNFLASGITSVTMASLTSVGFQLSGDASPALTSVSFPSLLTTADQFTLIGCNVLASISAPSLVSVGADLEFSTCPTLSSVTLTALTTVSAGIDFHTCASLVTISFPALANLGSNMDGHNCAALTTLSIGGAVVIQADMVFNLCPNLASVSMPNLTFADNVETLDFSGGKIVAGNSLAGTGINGILHRGAVSPGPLMNETFTLNGGTNAGIASLSAQGAADLATLSGNGNIVALNP